MILRPLFEWLQFSLPDAHEMRVTSTRCHNFPRSNKGTQARVFLVLSKVDVGRTSLVAYECVSRDTLFLPCANMYGVAASKINAYYIRSMCTLSRTAYPCMRPLALQGTETSCRLIEAANAIAQNLRERFRPAERSTPARETYSHTTRQMKHRTWR